VLAFRCGSVPEIVDPADRLIVDTMDSDPGVAQVLARSRAVRQKFDSDSRRSAWPRTMPRCIVHGQPERLRPIDRKQQGARLTEEFALGALIDLADIFDAGQVEQRGDGFAEIASSTLSILAAILIGIPSAWAIRIARSGRFSGEMRPRNAT